MKILITGGGTAGHINPAIAIAQEFKKRDENTEILFVGTPKGMESKLVPQAGFDFAGVDVKGFSRSFAPEDIIHNFKAVGLAIKAKKASRDVIKSFNPDIAIGTGGYVAGPVMLEATKLGIKTAIHESNAFPGVTNKILAPKVDYVFGAVEDTKNHLKNVKNFEVVGNPLKESIVSKSKSQARAELGLDDRPLVLCFGGSLGATTINKIGADLIEWNLEKDKINIVHGYGKNNVLAFPQLLKERKIKELPPNIKALEYIDNMETYLAAADIVICRAGAMTISELQATGKPAILIPSPNVTENHQYHNAKALVDKNAGLMIEEKTYTTYKLTSMINKLVENPKQLEELSTNISKMAILDTASKICNILTE